MFLVLKVLAVILILSMILSVFTYLSVKWFNKL